MNSKFSQKTFLWIIIGAILAGMVQMQAAQKSYESKSSIGLGYGLPYGGLGLNYEINSFAPKGYEWLNNLGLSLGLGGAPAGGFCSLTCRYYLLGRERRFNLHSSLTGIIGYNIEDKKIVGDLGIGSALLFFVNSAISVEAGLTFTLFNHEFIPIIGLRWNFYKK